MDTDIAGICNAVSVDGDECLVGITFLQADLANNLGVGDIAAAIGRDVMIVDRCESVCTGDAFVSGLVGEGTNALT